MSWNALNIVLEACTKHPPSLGENKEEVKANGLSPDLQKEKL